MTANDIMAGDLVLLNSKVTRITPTLLELISDLDQYDRNGLINGLDSIDLSPEFFEKNGFITSIDHYMLEHVAKDQKEWLDQGKNLVPVSVNFSRAHFAESDLAEQIRDSVDKIGTPHKYIEIELTESAFFDDKKALISTITRLREYGFAVSMDDFGSGYSSLNSLKDMPLDVLKLDAEFFRGENAGERGEIVVAEAIKLAKSLNMRTVAEGVEIKEQVDFLAAQGCDMIQGYYYAKPMAKEDYEGAMEAE
jgi:EAL domain-containing protein (putative c-di-GMP-specific phosphodiesterase class I)